MDQITLAVDFRKERKPFRHFFGAVGYANADYTYTEASQKMYDYLSSYHNHFRYMRLHNILTLHGKGDFHFLQGHDYGNASQDCHSFDDDAVVSLDDAGRLVYDWTWVDRVYDIMLEHQIRPIVETVYLPSCIQKSRELGFIPKDFKLWRQLLEDFVRHLEERYGRAEVEQWYFEVWNEPDNHGPWVEEPASFFALYDYMEAAIHAVNPRIKVGGPAVKQGEEAFKIFRLFLEHCARGVNYVTGCFGTRIDFISVHCKGGFPNGYNPSSEVLFDALGRFLECLKEYPEFDGVEFFNDESDIVWHGNLGIWKESWLNFRNTHYPAGFVCKMITNYCAVVEDQHQVNLSIVDSDNCHIQWERFLFSGNRSQLTPLTKYPSTDLLKKAIFNAYVLLSRLGDERLAASCATEGFGRKFGILPTRRDDALAIMVWNFEDGVEDDVNRRRFRLEVSNLPFTGAYRLVHYRIDREHSNAHAVWKSLGAPGQPSAEQIQSLREREGLELYEPVRPIVLDGPFRADLDLPMHAVSLLLLVPENRERPARLEFIKAVAETGCNGNRQVFLKWRPCPDRDFLYYRVWRRGDDEAEFRVISDAPSLNTATYTDMAVSPGRTYEYRIQSLNASLLESDCSEASRVALAP
ncbi:xylan 1,4-beta-xylosidase [Hydrogenispora ethanolica]|jgi:xylan 1,4-beta-xylosidase|uniref:Xylan 1,4-beta-xylosidase n=1 Tax=Hydrogenispora ethanolica TaxID=1082276 RepID=A0A4R1S3I0_HYDET|nr:hypothetical protein [Hydrogenispora ethanolica]TCL73180.1 xylan 1,4-beta-xylosidase [Hydrogenispora ethanolica]